MEQDIWKSVPDVQLMHRHYTIELKSSLEKSPYLIICSNNEAMKPGSEVAIGVRGSIQTGKCAADVYTSHWRFEPDPQAELESPGGTGVNRGLNIVNKKSGLPLRDGNRQGGPWIDLPVDTPEGGHQQFPGAAGPRDRVVVAERLRLDETTKQWVGANAFCFLRPAVATFDLSKGTIQASAELEVLIATHPQNAWPHRRLEWSKKYAARFLSGGEIRSKAIGEDAVFRLMPATWEFDAAHRSLDLPKADVQKQIVEIWLGAIGVGFTNLGAGMQGSATKISEMLGPASAGPLAIGAILSIVQAALATSELLDGQGKKSDLEILYDSLIPEIKKIVQEEFDQHDLREAMRALDEARSHFLDAVMMYKGWCEKMNFIENNLTLIAPTQQTALGQILDSDLNAGYDAMSSGDREQIGGVFQLAHAKFEEGLNRLRLNRNARIALGPFSTGALAHIALLFHLSLLSYSLWHEVLAHAIVSYRDHIRRTFEEIRKRRLSHFGFQFLIFDGFYSGSKDACVADRDIFNFLTTTIESFAKTDFETWMAAVEKASKGPADMHRDMARVMEPRMRPSSNNYWRHVERSLEIDFLQPMAIADRLDKYQQCLHAMDNKSVDLGLLAEIRNTANWAPVGG